MAAGWNVCGRHGCGITLASISNAAMLHQARGGWPDHAFLRGDMTSLPFADGAFDGVMSMFGAMGHLPLEGQHRMMDEIVRVLTPGGLAIVTNGNTWSPFNLPTTLKGNRVRLEGVRFKVHSSNPRRFPELLQRFKILTLESYDYSYIPITAAEVRRLPPWTRLAPRL